ncbi:hypothetical protein Gogos_001837, partial [Gossypium gossypioides]|nr:hypothetical protein [Gossypium gossypioides]
MHNSPGISIALIFITVGFGFKLSPALFQDLQYHAGEMGAGKRDPGKGGIGYVDKGKAIIKSLIVFVKASNHEELGECSTKPVLIEVVKK